MVEYSPSYIGEYYNFALPRGLSRGATRKSQHSLYELYAPTPSTYYCVQLQGLGTCGIRKWQFSIAAQRLYSMGTTSLMEGTGTVRHIRNGLKWYGAIGLR